MAPQLPARFALSRKSWRRPSTTSSGRTTGGARSDWKFNQGKVPGRRILLAFGELALGNDDVQSASGAKDRLGPGRGPKSDPDQ